MASIDIEDIATMPADKMRAAMQRFPPNSLDDLWANARDGTIALVSFIPATLAAYGTAVTIAILAGVYALLNMSLGDFDVFSGADII